jgi:hypothetical protein
MAKGGFAITKLFFDRKAVTDKVDKAARRVLSRFGAFVRRTAKSSIRKRKKPAPPGQPPSSHTGLLKKFIFFGYEPGRKSVVIGPVRLGGKIGDAPHALEHGGTSSVIEKRRERKLRMAARPFMGPALQKEKPKLPGMWADSVKK